MNGFTQWVNWCVSLGEQALTSEPLSSWERFHFEFYQSFVEADRWELYLEGFGNTMKVTFFSLILGVFIGIFVAVIRSMHDQQKLGQRNPVLGLLNFGCKIYTTVIRGTPAMVQLLIMSFVILKSSRNNVLVASLAFGINSGAYVAEIVRGGIMSVDGGQMEAGRSLGMGYLKTMRFIVIPQAVKNILPALFNEFISLFKETSIVTVIGLRDLTKVATLIQGRTFGGFMSLFGVAFIYLLVVMLLTWVQSRLERSLRKSDRR